MPCLLIRDGLDQGYIILYVDDLLNVCFRLSGHRVKMELSDLFIVTNFGPCSNFLGIMLYHAGSGMFLSQAANAAQIV